MLLLVARLVAQVADAHLDRQLLARLLLDPAVDVLVRPSFNDAALAIDEDRVSTVVVRHEPPQRPIFFDSSFGSQQP